MPRCSHIRERSLTSALAVRVCKGEFAFPIAVIGSFPRRNVFVVVVFRYRYTMFRLASMRRKMKRSMVKPQRLEPP